MKITVSRDEIKEIIRKFYNLEQDIQIEISSDKAEPKVEPEIRYKSTYDSNGMLIDMVPINPDGSLVNPHVNHKGQKFKYENTCKVCGKVFYTNSKAADCCSKECLTQLNKQCLSEIEEAELHKETELAEEKRKHSQERTKRAKEKVLHEHRDKRKKSTKKAGTESKAFSVKNPKNDYLILGEEIENFYNSSEAKKIVTSETLSPQGLYYRYRVAAKMFGYDDKIKMSTSEKNNGLVISKR